MHEVMNPGRQTSWTGINMVMVVGWCELSSLYSTGALVLYWWEGLKCSSILSVSRGLGTSRPVLPLRSMFLRNEIQEHDRGLKRLQAGFAPTLPPHLPSHLLNDKTRGKIYNSPGLRGLERIQFTRMNKIKGHRLGRI